MTQVMMHGPLTEAQAEHAREIGDYGEWVIRIVQAAPPLSSVQLGRLATLLGLVYRGDRTG